MRAPRNYLLRVVHVETPFPFLPSNLIFGRRSLFLPFLPSIAVTPMFYSLFASMTWSLVHCSFRSYIQRWILNKKPCPQPFYIIQYAHHLLHEKYQLRKNPNDIDDEDDKHEEEEQRARKGWMSERERKLKQILHEREIC